jgi:hypothetical protein
MGIPVETLSRHPAVGPGTGAAHPASVQPCQTDAAVFMVGRAPEQQLRKESSASGSPSPSMGSTPRHRERNNIAFVVWCAFVR